MPLLVPTSTIHVPDGTNVPSTNPWVGQLSLDDELFFFIDHALRDGPGAHNDYDVIISDLSTTPPTAHVVLNPQWTSTSVSGNFTIPRGSAYGLFLETGGGAPFDTSGTVFGFQMSVVYATPGFNTPDASSLLQVQQELAPYDWIVALAHRNVVNRTDLTLQLSTTALYWVITSDTSNLNTSGGNPNYYFTDSFCTPLQHYGFSRSTRVSFTPQLMMLPPVTTAVSFWLNHGVTLDVFELTPGNSVHP